jgi:hypothetical protein
MKKVILILLSIILFASCSNQNIDLNVYSESRGKVNTNKKAYLMNTSYTKYSSKEISMEIVEALKKAGFDSVATPEEAEIVILVSYGVTEPHTVRFVADCDGGNVDLDEDSFQESVYYNYISFTGIDLKELRTKNIRVPVWKTYASFYSSVDRFQVIFPYLLSAVSPYFGQNLDKPIEVNQPLELEEKEGEKKETKVKK